MRRSALILMCCGWLITGNAQDGQVLPVEDGMLSYEAFVPPEPDYTVEVIIFRNLNTSYNRKEDWSKPELRIGEIPAGLTYDGEASDNQIGNDQSEPYVDPYGDNFFADEGPVVVPDLQRQTVLDPELIIDPDDKYSQGLVQGLVQHMEPLDCPALIEVALLTEGSAPQECTADIVRFVPMEPALLAQTYLALENTADYRPLAILAWSQQGYPRLESPVFELRPLGVVGDAISGTVSLSRGRYLHLDLDLSFVPGLDFESGPMGTDSTSATMALVAEQMNGTDTYRLHESRRMRRDEIHYFDHPEFAALAIVTRYEPPDDSEAEEAIGDMPIAADGN